MGALEELDELEALGVWLGMRKIGVEKMRDKSGFVGARKERFTRVGSRYFRPCPPSRKDMGRRMFAACFGRSAVSSAEGGLAWLS